MSMSFKFLDDRLQRRLLSLLEAKRVAYRIDKRGVIYYSPAAEELVDNKIINSIRNRVFPIWQLLSCPKEWEERYREYMVKRAIPFREELINGQLCFLLPRTYRPHRWKKI